MTIDPHAIDLSIIIVTWNAERHIGACLRSLADTSIRTRGEVFVVDNGSADRTCLIVGDEFPWVTLVPTGANLGFARGCNVALPQARGRYLLLLNPDTQVPPNFVDALLKRLDKHREVGIAGCRLANAQGQAEPTGYARPTLRSIFVGRVVAKLPGGSRLARLIAHHEDRTTSEPPVKAAGWVSGACLAIRREVYDQIGTLDERYFMYSEDADWCFRARQAGWQVVCFTDLTILHEWGSRQRYDFDVLSRHVDSERRFFEKHFGARAGAIYRLLIALAIGLNILSDLARLLLCREGVRHTDLRRSLRLCAWAIRSGFLAGQSASTRLGATRSS